MLCIMFGSKNMLFIPPQNQERKHRTYVYVLIVTEHLEDWEDSVNIGKSPHLFTSQETGIIRTKFSVSHMLSVAQALVILQFWEGGFITQALFLPL